MNDFLQPIQEKRKYYEQHPEQVKQILDRRNKKSQRKSRKTDEASKTSHENRLLKASNGCFYFLE